MANQGLIKNYTADGAIPASSIVKLTANRKVAIATAVTDALLAVNESLDVVDGESVDVILNGTANVKFGGAVARGQPVTSNAAGQGVYANPAQGANNRIIGFALETVVAGDIAPVQLAPGQIQG
ncbi:MAG: DUF2190 family protein [Candidatus Pacebacteria bacterium]|nr:DUF2190 family protein [Candidatus Paceibacterota bacterium]